MTTGAYSMHPCSHPRFTTENIFPRSFLFHLELCIYASSLDFLTFSHTTYLSLSFGSFYHPV